MKDYWWNSNVWNESLGLEEGGETQILFYRNEVSTDYV